MPHYRDGAEARVGDIVRDLSGYYGPTHRVGEVMTIAPGATSCNALVAFIEDPTHPRATAVQGPFVVGRTYDGATPAVVRALSVCTITLGDMTLLYRPPSE